MEATSTDLRPAVSWEKAVDGCSGDLYTLVYSDSLYMFRKRENAN